jgi:hypothetical protein
VCIFKGEWGEISKSPQIYGGACWNKDRSIAKLTLESINLNIAPELALLALLKAFNIRDERNRGTGKLDLEFPKAAITKIASAS